MTETLQEETTLITNTTSNVIRGDEEGCGLNEQGKFECNGLVIESVPKTINQN